MGRRAGSRSRTQTRPAPTQYLQSHHGLCSKNHVVKLGMSKTMVRATPTTFPPDLVVPASGKNSRKGTWRLTKTWLSCGWMSWDRGGSGALNDRESHLAGPPHCRIALGKLQRQGPFRTLVSALLLPARLAHSVCVWGGCSCSLPIPQPAGSAFPPSAGAASPQPEEGAGRGAALSLQPARARSLEQQPPSVG